RWPADRGTAGRRSPRSARVAQLEPLAHERHVGRELALENAPEVRLVARAPRLERAVVLPLGARELRVDLVERDDLHRRRADQRPGVTLAVEQDGELADARDLLPRVLVLPQGRRRRGLLARE